MPLHSLQLSAFFLGGFQLVRKLLCRTKKSNFCAVFFFSWIFLIYFLPKTKMNVCSLAVSCVCVCVCAFPVKLLSCSAETLWKAGRHQHHKWPNVVCRSEYFWFILTSIIQKSISHRKCCGHLKSCLENMNDHSWHRTTAQWPHALQTHSEKCQLERNVER